MTRFKATKSNDLTESTKVFHDYVLKPENGELDSFAVVKGQIHKDVVAAGEAVLRQGTGVLYVNLLGLTRDKRCVLKYNTCVRLLNWREQM